MRDRLWIVVGLLLFVSAFAAPFWHAAAHSKIAARAPDLQLPANAKECVAPVDYMRASHMRMLLQWRESAVRQGDRQYVAFNHKHYQKSLTGTCWGCHNRAAFCDRCHAYAGVSTPYCWNCHNEPQTKIARGNTP